MKLSKGKKKLLKTVVMIAVIYFTASAFMSSFAQIKSYNDKIAALSDELEAENKRNKELNTMKNQVHSDKNYKEIARNTLGLVEPGDKVYVNSNDNNK